MAAALNGLDTQCADIQSAFLTAPNLEKLYLKAGPEFGDLEGRYFIVKRALYGLKSAGFSFRSFLAKKLDEIGFKSCIADPDVWRRAAVKDDGTEYYEYIMTYVDDIIAVSEKATDALKSITNERIKFKNGKIEPPDMYLGAKLRYKHINGIGRWTISSEKYVEAAVNNVKEILKKNNRYKLPKGMKTPMSGNYLPELDGSPELGSADITLFQELIGILRWATELGRVDILFEVSILSQHSAMPREGHLEQVFNIFAFLDQHPKLTIHMDPELPNINYSVFDANRFGFDEQYRDATELIPSDRPEPRGNGITITCYVDASHAQNKVTRRSHTGYIIFVNKAPIYFYSKRQQTVETSAFGSEFIALKVCIEAVRSLRYKLRMFGIPILKDVDGMDEPAYIFCDNEAVVKNCTKVESALHKKHNSVAYHMARWSMAAHETVVGWVDTQFNLADALTKRLSKWKREQLFWNWTY